MIRHAIAYGMAAFVGTIAAPAGAAVSFEAARVYDEPCGGADPCFDVMTGDFTGDGKADVVLVGDDVVLARGRGDGDFDDGVVILTSGSNLVQASAADFNGDGRRDLAVALYRRFGCCMQPHIAVAFNQGGGVFGPPQTVFTWGSSGSFRWIRTGDFNADGKADIAAGTDHGGGQPDPAGFIVVLGHGDGTFAPGTSVPVGAGTRTAQAADLNGDGAADLVAFVDQTSGIVVALSNGDGTFGPLRTYYTGPWGWEIATGDFNGDHKVDVAVTLSENYAVAVLWGVGDGTFPLPTYVQPRGAPLGLAAADMDGNGIADLVVGLGGSYGLSVLLGGTGGFSAPVPSVLFDRTTALAVADFNADGIVDTAAVRAVPGSRGEVMGIALGKGGGAFHTAAFLPTGSQYARGVAIGDLDRDGRNDIAVANWNDTVSILMGTGGGSFAAPQIVAVGGSPAWVRVGDVNGDLNPDLVFGLGRFPYVALLRGNGNGTFQTPLYAPVASKGVANYPAIADFDQDGKQDLMARTEAYVVLLRGSANGGFQPAQPVFLAPPGLGHFSVGDLNNDGRDDVILSSRHNGINYTASFLGNGDGTFSFVSAFSPNNLPVGIVRDFDGDGHGDFAHSFDVRLGLWLGNGDGTFHSTSTPVLDTIGSLRGAADLDADGRLDLVAGGVLFPAVQVFAGGAGTTFFPSWKAYAAGNADGNTEPTFYGGELPLAIGDLNGDGKPDIVHAGASDGVMVLRNTTP